MRCKYLISWMQYGGEQSYNNTCCIVRDFTDKELENYVIENGWKELKIQFICIVPEVPLNRRHVM